MMTKLKYTCFLMLLSYASLKAQPVNCYKEQVEFYINLYHDIAVYEMLQYRIPASITLAQGLLESEAGQSRLAVDGKNHFGIKCKKDWTGMTIKVDDDELQECFRVYESVYDSYRDHTEFLVNNRRYAMLFDLEPGDYKGWANGLHTTGYATNPKYAELLINLIEKFNLDKYDKEKEYTGDYDAKIDKYELVETNGLSSIIAKPGDSFTRIAIAQKMKIKDLLLFNDLQEVKDLRRSEIVYLEMKNEQVDKLETYTVKNGETLRSISQSLGIRLSVLSERNGLQPGEDPLTGEVLTLNKINPVTVKKKEVFREPKTLVKENPVKPASREDSTATNEPGSFDQDNDDAIATIDSTSLYKGNKKNIAKTTHAAAQKAKAPELTTETYHYVKKGETLYSISKRYKVSVKDLRKWNHLKTDAVYPKQKLRVSNRNVAANK
jgi:LysM repeat protein